MKSAKEVSKQDARQKLATNAEAIKSNPVRIEAGEDNRFQRLHSARFLGGARMLVPDRVAQSQG